MKDTKRSSSTSTKLHRIAQLAKKFPNSPLTTLSHHIDLELLRDAQRRTRKDGAVGVDGETAAGYEKDLEENLRELLNRAKSGRYRAPPVRRTYIQKEDGSKRPIGIPTYEDKVLQRAAVMVLTPVYEQVFKDCSYGFRPGRSAHQALEDLWKGITRMGGGWIIDLDISSYFDTIDRRHLREFIQRRVRDGVLIRLIGKWLNAGVMEEGNLTKPDRGTPQGGVVSPLLANIFLHYVLDEWWQDEVLPRMRGEASLVRFADDAVLVFRRREDAERVMRVLPKRFERYGLRLHPEKTRMVRFEKPPRGGTRGWPKPGTFDFLGFTHYWGRSRKGRPTVKRKTSPKKYRRILKRFNQWLRRVRHLTVKWQHEKLCKAIMGHDAYYGITGNSEALSNLRYHVARLWRKWLSRRSWKANMPWEKFQMLLQRYPLPRPRVVHSVYR